MQHTSKYSQNSSIIGPIWTKCWVFFYKLSGCGIESRWSHFLSLFYHILSFCNLIIEDSDAMFITVVIKKCDHLHTSSKNVHPLPIYPQYTYICTSYLPHCSPSKMSSYINIPPPHPTYQTCLLTPTQSKHTSIKPSIIPIHS